MRVLVAYATRHGATQGIAEHIARTLQDHGLEVDAQPIGKVSDIGSYDAFVIGSAVYVGRWLNDAADFVRWNRVVLRSHPTWLFSSGPTGADTVDRKGRDVLEASRPLDFDEWELEVKPRDMRVFFGAYDPDAVPVGVVEHIGALFTHIPAIRRAIPTGDFRDWPAIAAWADAIARELLAVASPA